MKIKCINRENVKYVFDHILNVRDIVFFPSFRKLKLFFFVVSAYAVTNNAVI